MRALLLALLALVAVPVAAAPGVSIRWNSCFPDAASRISRSFACDTNAGFELLVGSFQTYEAVPEVTGIEIVVDLHTGRTWPYRPPAVPLPEWWKFRNAGSCRINALSMNFFQYPENEACPDWSGAQAVGGIGTYSVDHGGPGTARILAASAVPAASAAFIAKEVEYFMFNLVVRHDRTVGADACTGCDVPIELVLTSVKLTTPISANDRTLYGPANFTDSNFVIWTPDVVPVAKTTWGAVKSLYR